MKTITVATTVNAALEKVWEDWTTPDHVTRWYFASDDWEAPVAENDLRVGGTFKTAMAAKDGSAGFDFGGTYTVIVPQQRIEYTINGDGRPVTTLFEPVAGGVRVTQMFAPETKNSEELQRNGWQAILHNFKKYVEHT